MKTLLLIALLLYSAPALAQGFYTEFGQNRLQFMEEDWRFYEMGNHRIYYHTGGQNLARFALLRSEEHITELQRVFDYTMRDRMELMIFTSLTTLRQSNLSQHQDAGGANTGGITPLRDNQVLVYFDGNYQNFERDLQQATSRALVNEMLFGGDARERLQNAALIDIPWWHQEGLIRYSGREWTTEDNDQLKRLVRTGRLFNIHYLNNEEKALAGQSFWNYLEDRYGRSAVANIIYMIRLNKSFESGFRFVLGQSREELESQWEREMNHRYQQPGNSVEDPLISFREQNIRGYPGSFTVNNQGNQLAFVAHNEGKSTIYLYDQSENKTVLLKSRGYRTDLLPVENTWPVVAFHPRNDQLLIFKETDGRLFYQLYDVAEDAWEDPVRIQRLDKVLSASFHPDGSTVALSAVRGGQTNIYTLNIRTQRVTPITNDAYTDLDPVFVRQGRFLLFASDRKVTNIAKSSSNPAQATLNPSFNIYFYDYQTRNPNLKPITRGTLVNHMRPVEYDGRYFGYETNENGAYNRNAAFLDSTFQYIEVIASFQTEQRDSFRYDSLYFYNNDTSAIQVPNKILSDTNLLKIDTSFVYEDFVNHYPLTTYEESVIQTIITDSVRRNLYELHYLGGSFAISEKRFPRDIPGGIVNREPVSTYASIPSIKKYQSQKSADRERDNEVENDRPPYYFLSPHHNFAPPNEDVKPEKQTHDHLETGREQPRHFRFPSSRIYFTSFTPERFVSQINNSVITSPYQPFNPDDPFVYDPGMNALLELTLTDRLNNYVLRGGVGFGLDLQGLDIYGAFANRSNRLNREYMFFRQSKTSRPSRALAQRRVDNEFRLRMTWPFTETFSLRGDIFTRTQQLTTLSTNQETLTTPDDLNIWAGLKTELVFDNSRSLGKNLPWGWRAKTYAEFYGNTNRFDHSFSVAGADVRHYMKLHRNLIWANRAAGAATLGRNNLIFFMGGVENWIMPEYNEGVSAGRDPDYAFKTLAANMRGFPQNIRNGHAYAVWNSEIRWPFIQYFMRREHRSPFMRDLQLTLFSDVGTAWRGQTPFSEENIVSEQIIERQAGDGAGVRVIFSPLSHPIVWGYGAGLRSSILGYFVKVDYGWGREGLEDPVNMLHLSFGLDF